MMLAMHNFDYMLTIQGQEKEEGTKYMDTQLTATQVAG